MNVPAASGVEGTRAPGEQDSERGSLPMVMLLTMVGLALGTVLVPTVLVQSRSTVFTTNRQNALHAAQAGVDTAIGRIRATSPDGGTADTTKLPCTTTGNPVSGPVAGAGAETFAAQISYYVSDPVKFTSATPMTCVPGKGVYDSASGISAPAYARITSVGTDGASTGTSRSRTVVSTYAFQTTNANVAGGQIRIFPPNTDPTTPRMCMDAGSGPASGTTVRLQPCSTASPVSATQVFAYRSDLTLQVSTTAVNTATYPNGLCLDTDVSSGAPVAGKPITLQPCNASTSTPPYSQQWSSNDTTAYQASLSASRTNGTLSNQCIYAANQNAGTTLALATCIPNGATDAQAATEAWFPEPTVGAGAANDPQLVNYLQFNRCLDLTAGATTVNAEAGQFVHLYPCKQNPQAGSVAFNQRWIWDGTNGWIYILNTNNSDGLNPAPGTKLCLYSPFADGIALGVTKCSQPTWANPALTVDSIRWKKTGADPSVPYANRYRFIDSSPDVARCLSISTTPAERQKTIRPGDPWSAGVVAPCNGSSAQKWNADPSVGAPTVQDTVERPNSS